MGEPGGRWAERGSKAVDAAKMAWLHALTQLGIEVPLDQFDGAEFGDFLWQSLFSPSLPASDFERCRTARYVALWAPWRALHATASIRGFRHYARIDTRGYDVCIAQTPWPGTVSAETRLVIRYHDAMPLFLPHTVKQSRLHHFFHMTALSANAKSASFACVSEDSRSQLLKVFPELERRAFVVHDCIGDEYFPSTETPEAVPGIIASRIDPSTEPDFGRLANRKAFYDVHLPARDFRYLLLVGTMEPRKNYLGFLKAWERLRSLPNRPTAIVCVSSAGWNNSDIKSAMQRWQARGELFHLSSVSSSEMRTLYSSAEAVVCPSVAEGFDLPSVEAIRCGAAVAASDIPIHREMLGEAALYFNPYSTDSMTETIARFLTDRQVKAGMQSAIANQASKFSKSVVSDQWQQMLESCRAMPLPAGD